MSIICTPRNRCNDWRSCDRCARIRQAKIADVAENRLARNHYLTFLVLKTNEPVTLATDRERLIRSVSNLSSGGLWTIEAGEQFRGLHINLLVASETPLKIARIRKAWGELGEVWAEPVFGWREYWNEVKPLLPNLGHHHSSEPIFKNQLINIYERNGDKFSNNAAAGLEETGNAARNIAAYISKRAGQPTKAEYSGRIYGTWGNARNKPAAVNEILISENMQNSKPLIAGLALTTAAADNGLIDKSPSRPAQILAALREIKTTPESKHFAVENQKVTPVVDLPTQIVETEKGELKALTAAEWIERSRKIIGYKPPPEPPPKPHQQKVKFDLPKVKGKGTARQKALALAGVGDLSALEE